MSINLNIKFQCQFQFEISMTKRNVNLLQQFQIYSLTKNINENKDSFEKIYNIDERLIRFAGESIFFVRELEKTYELEYYKNQLIRSLGSSSLNYGEAQGTITSKDFIFKVSFVVKELKESRNSLKVVRYIKEGNASKQKWLIDEVEELIAITSKMIINKK